MRHIKYNRKNAFKTGFTLVETLVAITILMIAVIVPLSIVANALQSSYFARDQITATYLAQDAIEYIRSLRDTDAIVAVTGTPGATWFSSLDASCKSGVGCDVDTIDHNTHTGPLRGPLRYDDQRGIYHASWNNIYPTLSRFTRKVKISGPAPEYKVTVEVSWTGSIPGTLANGQARIRVSESLYNVWQ